MFPAVFELLRGGGGDVLAPLPSHPQQGSGAPTHGFGFAPAHQRSSRELASGCAAIRAGDPRGLASCNLTFTRLRGCKGFN